MHFLGSLYQNLLLAQVSEVYALQLLVLLQSQSYLAIFDLLSHFFLYLVLLDVSGQDGLVLGDGLTDVLDQWDGWVLDIWRHAAHLDKIFNAKILSFRTAVIPKVELEHCGAEVLFEDVVDVVLTHQMLRIYISVLLVIEVRSRIAIDALLGEGELVGTERNSVLYALFLLSLLLLLS